MYLKDIEFSLWADFIEREFLKSTFKELIAKGIINGATSNPAIFKEAILNSPAYKEQLAALQGLDPKKKYEALAIYDIKQAAQILRPLYERSDDGFVSIEVDPRLADDASATVKEALRLVEAIAEENVMIKVPATIAGAEAIEELVAKGVNVNATLIFSPAQAREVLDALERGFKEKQPYAVLSIFVSRFDRKLDPLMRQKGLPVGRVGIVNAAKIYNMIKKRDLPNTKALFASTSVKGDDYPAHYYISELVAPKSINTAPIHTIEAFVKEGDKKAKLPIEQEEIDKFFAMLKANEIDMKQIYYELLQEGLQAFVQAFEQILEELR